MFSMVIKYSASLHQILGFIASSFNHSTGSLRTTRFCANTIRQFLLQFYNFHSILPPLFLSELVAAVAGTLLQCAATVHGDRGLHVEHVFVARILSMVLSV